MHIPTVSNLTQWTWVVIDTQTTAVTLNNLTPGFDFYYTTRPAGDTAPTSITRPKKPIEAIKMFNNPNVFANTDEFVLEAQTHFDLYVFCFSRDNTILADGILLVKDGVGNSLPVNPRGGLDVDIQDQTTDPIIVYFNKVHDSTTLDAAVPDITTDPRIITVVSATGIVVGSYIILFDPVSVRFSTFFATAVSGVNITLDSPIDFAYPEGAFVDVAIVDMSVNGSITPQVFGLRGVGAPPGIELSFDVTRIIFTCIAASPVSLSLFADIPALTNGLLLRSRNGRRKNIFNAKDNREIQGLMFDYTPSTATNPAQGEDGFVSRLTFAGQNKMGIAIRLPIGEDLEAWIQDNWLAITSFRIHAEGHIVEEIQV